MLPDRAAPSAWPSLPGCPSLPGWLLAGATPSSTISPAVSVPVLSSTIALTRCADSRICGPAMSAPIFAARPEPTISAVGVASPSAHGQATTSTVIALVSAASSGLPRASRTANVPVAMAIIAGTNTAEMRSASACTGAFPDCARLSKRPICARVVSAPTRLVRTVSEPAAFTVAPVTSAPGPISTGTDSPVRREASTAEFPVTTTPSLAICSPGATWNTSPTSSCAAGMTSSTTLPSARRVRRAVLAPRLIRARRASPALRREESSRRRPSRRKVTIMAADSKYRCGAPPWAME